jgi:hypothetical protein
LLSFRRIKSKKRNYSGNGDANNGYRKISPLETAKLARTAMNSVHAYASLVGLPRDDIMYIEKQFRLIHTIVQTTESKIETGFDELAFLATGGVGKYLTDYPFVFSKAMLLAQFGGVEIEEQKMLAICEQAIIQQTEPAGQVEQNSEKNVQKVPNKVITEMDDINDSFLIDFKRWLPFVLSYHRSRCIVGVLSERRRGKASFLQTQSTPTYGSIQEFQYSIVDGGNSIAAQSMLESPSVANTYSSNDLFNGYNVYGG